MLPARLAAVSGENVSDEQLMLRYRDGDAEAFEALYGRHRAQVFRYVLRQVGLRSAAEEVFQETWMNIIAARSRYRVQARFATFLYHIAHNCVVDHFRRKTPLHLISLDDNAEEAIQVAASERDQPERAVASRQLSAKLLNALSLLPPEQREAFLLHQEGGLTLEEIATITSTGRETVKSRLRYALAKLREGVEHEADVA
ncbi:MAG: RNA polymerase sigma factor [Burkholderiales bacterium]|jgi:RNA polymerase sigma-70 factor (ECF subfamily)